MNQNKNHNQDQNQNQNPPTNICHRCGKSGHWSWACHAPKHVVDQYKASINAVETKLLDGRVQCKGIRGYHTSEMQ